MDDPVQPLRYRIALLALAAVLAWRLVDAAAVQLADVRSSDLSAHWSHGFPSDERRLERTFGDDADLVRALLDTADQAATIILFAEPPEKGRRRLRDRLVVLRSSLRTIFFPKEITISFGSIPPEQRAAYEAQLDSSFFLVDLSRTTRLPFHDRWAEVSTGDTWAIHRFTESDG